jgi:hypothetical protein
VEEWCERECVYENQKEKKKTEDPGMIVGVEGVDKRRKRRESHNAVERRQYQ